MDSKYITVCEKLPAYIVLCYKTNLSTGVNTIIDLTSKELQGRWVELDRLWVTRDPNVTIQVWKNGYNRIDLNANALSAEENKLRVVNSKRFKFTIQAAADVSGYVFRVGVWIYKPTIADKLLEGVRLTDEEATIAGDLGVFDRFEKGLVPFTKNYVIDRYTHGDEFVYSIRETLTTDGLDYSYLSPSEDKFLALKGISIMDTSAVTDNAFCVIKADGVEVLKIPCSAMSIDTDIPLFIAGVESLSVHFETDAQVDNFRARWKIGNYRLNDYLKMLFGITKREEDEELWREVIAGI